MQTARTDCELLRFFLDTRQLYTTIKLVYLKNLPSRVTRDLPNLKPEERSLKEFVKGEEELQMIKEDVEFVMKGKNMRLFDYQEVLPISKW